jgi:hypothetical protein
MITSTMRSLALIIITALSAGCGDGGDAPAPDRPVYDSVRGWYRAPGADSIRIDTMKRVVVDSVPRDATKRDTISLEGDQTPIDVKLVETDLYSTYYPAEEMIADHSASGEGTGLRFVASFGGERNDSAFLHIFTPADPTAGPDVARRLLLGEHGIVTSNGWSAENVTTSSWCAWSHEAYALTGSPGIIGFACIGDHRGRGFIVVAMYPESYEEGMGPRIDYILDELRWTDTRTPLAREEESTIKLE